jgi:ubiquinone/menaquinone biosynthesis C-methylase UbiE
MTGQMRIDDTGHVHCGLHHMPEEERRQWQNPEAILREIGLKPGDTFVDIGCGNGYFSLPAARMVGEKGTVYGVDTDGEAIGSLDKSAKAEGLRNLKLTIGEAETAVFCEACADFVFLGIVLHDFRDPAAVLRNAAVMLKPGGRLVDLDWKKEIMPFGPPLEIRFDEAKAKSLIAGAGFKITSVLLNNLYHYMIIARL